MSRINPYNFVPLPHGGPDRSRGYPGRHRFQQDNYSGELVCTLKAISPLMTLDHKCYDLCILMDQNGQRLKKPVRGGGQKDCDPIKVFRFMRNHLGTPIIPGSSLKGMVRAVFEAMTRSCLNLLTIEGISTKSKNDKRPYNYEVPGGYDPAACQDIKRLCPTCRLFGVAQGDDLHCQGRLAISDAEFISGDWKVERRVLNELSNPKPHHDPTYAVKVGNQLFLRGRKFYYHQGDAPQFHIAQHHSNDRSIAIDEYALKGCTFIFSIIISDLTTDELGLLLLAIELCDGLGHKFGLGKALGLGSCRIDIDVGESRVFQARNRYNLAGPPPDNAWYALKKGPDCLPPELLEVLRLNKPDDEKNPSLKIGYPDYRGSYPKAPINARGFFSTQTYDPGTPANWPPRDCQHQKAAEGIAKLSAPPAQIVRETWKGAILTWTPGNQLITAVFRERKATVSGKDLVPEALHNSLFGRRKAKATVTVEKLGNAFRIVNIEAE